MSTFQSTPSILRKTLTPFLYPCLDHTYIAGRIPQKINVGVVIRRVACRSLHSTRPLADLTESDGVIDVHQYDHLDPSPLDYSSTPFTDSCTLSVAAGAGGHGCISFLREKYIANGPPNGGDGGTGGSVYIQAVRGETSLHKIARRGTLKAERGRNGQGSMKGGARGEDVVLTVPVGTVVREVWRHDPIDEQENEFNTKGFGRDAREDAEADTATDDQSHKWRRDKWLLYPGVLPRNFTSADFPALPRPRRSNLTAAQPHAPIMLDLDKPMSRPMLLAAGAMGGLGNPHFVTKSVTRPKYATKGEDGVRINLQLELKLLADVGLVGLPNAGKSTLLRALTKSRTRVGNWAFTTLAPTIGTLVLDNNLSRPILGMRDHNKEPRTSISIADIPGLIEGAHLDRGLGLGFLRHIERAATLAFVVDLSAGNAVAALQSLWREVVEYEKIREQETNAETQRTQPDEDGMVRFEPFQASDSSTAEPQQEQAINTKDLLLGVPSGRELSPLRFPPISSKPWFVVATKADLPDTQANFRDLKDYLEKVEAGHAQHPCGKKNAWRQRLQATPVSAMDKLGVDRIPKIIVELLAK